MDIIVRQTLTKAEVTVSLVLVEFHYFVSLYVNSQLMADTSLKQTARAAPECVHLRENSL